MRFYQFGRQDVDAQTALDELKVVGVVDDDFQPDDFPAALRTLFTKLFPEARSAGARLDSWNSIAVDAKRSLTDLLAEESSSIPAEDFYTINLQLLGFIVGEDFQPGEARAFMKKTLLPYLEAEVIDAENLVSAFYLMLGCRTMKGLTLFDELSSRGLLLHLRTEGLSQHLFFNGKSQPIFDTSRIIREVVYVEAPIDTDGDGARDLIEVAVFRPGETENGLRVPVLFTAEPYFKGIEDESKVVHDVNRDIAPKVESQTTLEDVTFRYVQPDLPPEREVKGEAAAGTLWGVDSTDYTLSDYFLGRGFAQVYSAGPGTKGSQGFRMGAGVEETIAAQAVVEWLTGKRRAFTDKTSCIEVKAWWCNGHVGMTDISYMGTLALAVATTGVAGLETIVSESGISSWYDYYRDHGLVLAPADCQGEDTDVLAQFTFSRIENGADYLRLKSKWIEQRNLLRTGQDRDSGSYNRYWDERNYRNHADNIACDVILVRGLNDWNVKPRNAEKLWAKLRGRTDLSYRLFLHQGQHQHMHNWRSIDYLDMLNLWFSYKLLGVDNQAEQLLPKVLVQDNTEPMKWSTPDDWASPTVPRQLWYPCASASQSTLADSPAQGTVSFVDDGTKSFLQRGITAETWQDEFLSVDNPHGRNQVRFLTEPFTTDKVIDGIIDVSVTVAVDQPVGKLSAMIVDYGKARRLAPTATDLLWLGHLRPLGYDYLWDQVQEFEFEESPSDFKMITKGHINLANRTVPYRDEDVQPGQFYSFTWDLQPTHWHLLPGHQLGLVLYSTDMGMTYRESRVATYTIDLAGTSLSVPLADLT